MAIVLLTSVAFVLACTSQGVGETKKIVTRLTVGSKPPYVARVEVENIGDQPISLLKWYFREDGVMPFELFVLEQKGKRIKYEGSFAKLPGTPRPEDYFVLKTGQRASVQFSLDQFYKLTTGTYSAQFAVSHLQPGGGVIQTISNVAPFSVVAR